MRADAVIAHVGEDMERIFAPLADRPVPSAPPAVYRGRRSMRAPVVLPVVAAIIGAGALAVAYGLNAVPPVQAPYRPVDRPITAHSLVLDSSITAGKPTEVASVAPVAVSAPVPAPSAEPSPVPSPDTASAQTPSPPAGTVRTIPQRVVRVDRENIAEPSEQRCEPGSAEDNCIYRDVMSADARLRRAYERAADAGVSPWLLASVNRRWERARDVSSENPDRAIDRYNRLADALDDERSDFQ